MRTPEEPIRPHLVRSGGVPLTVAMADAPSAAGVILLQEIWGVSSPLEAVAGRLADAGYLVAVPHLYHRSTEVGALVADEDFLAAAGLRAGLRCDDVTADLTAGLDWLHGQGARRFGVLGYSMGGTLALWAATALPVHCAVTFYGGGLISSPWRDIPAGVELVHRLRVPWMGLYGAADPSTPPEHLRRLRQAAGAAAGPTEIVDFTGADHGFALDPRDPRHDAIAAETAWRRTMQFLAETL